MDEASGVKKKETALVVASTTPKHNAVASWNKKVMRNLIFIEKLRQMFDFIQVQVIQNV